MSENGQRLLELCTNHHLCIANSYFKTKPQHKASWRHPHSKHWHQLDLILVRRAALQNVLHTRSYHSADCDTDHSLVCFKIKLQPRRIYGTKKQGNPASMLATRFSQTSWNNLLLRENLASHSPVTLLQRSGTMHYRTIFAKKIHDWFKAKSTEMTPVIEAKRAALAEYKRPSTNKNLQILRAAWGKAQQTANDCH